MKKDNKIPVLITTKHRGVFFGFIDPKDVDKDPLKVHEKQMCTKWSTEMRGVFGLAKYGPDKNCRIGQPVEWATLKNITAVVSCSEEAVKNWKKCPWG